jgi:hypothetical protein
MFLHGGGWTSGVRSEPYIVNIGEFAAKLGYAFASVSYRLDTLIYTVDEINADTIDLASPAFPLRPMANAMHDARAAVRFFRKEADLYRVDERNIFIGGDSAGGFTSLMVAYHDKLEEIPGDAVPHTVEGDSGNPGYSSSVTGVWFGCAASIAPHTMESDSDPILVAGMYSTGDPLVRPGLSFQTIQRARDIGMKPIGRTFDNGIHCSWLIPVIGVFDLISYGITLKDAVYSNLVVSTGLSADDQVPSVDLEIETFPIPFTDALNIRIVNKNGSDFRGTDGWQDSPPSELPIIKLYDVRGRLLRQQLLSSRGATIPGGLSAGVYVLVAEHGGRPIAKKIVVSK